MSTGWDRPSNPDPPRRLTGLVRGLVVLEVFHEFGHAYACRRFGGAVPEMGLFLIAMTPCAYVDASASWTFPSRWHRIAVALAGVWIESFIALVALLVWGGSPAGCVADVAVNIVILASVTMVMFNLNPLVSSTATTSSSIAWTWSTCRSVRRS